MSVLQHCDVVGCGVAVPRGPIVNSFVSSFIRLPDGWGRISVTVAGDSQPRDLCPVHAKAALDGSLLRDLAAVRTEPLGAPDRSPTQWDVDQVDGAPTTADLQPARGRIDTGPNR